MNGSIAELQTALKDKSRFTSQQLVDALTRAAVRGSLPRVEALLQAGAEPNRVDTNHSVPLICAIESGDPEVVEMIVRMGADLNRPDGVGNLPLMWAISSEVDSASQCREPVRCDVSKKLIELGADPSLRDVEGRDAVQLARELNHSPFLAVMRNRLA